MMGSPRLATLLLSAVIAGCGAGRQHADSGSGSGGAAVEQTRGYLNDADGDHPGDSENDNNHDTDNDPSQDYKPNENGLYHERDDNNIAEYGSAADVADERAIISMVKRYYAAAAAEDGAQACTMLVATLAQAIPGEYGQSDGPSYLRGHDTCAALMTALFRHSGAQMVGKFTITGVRVDGSHAFALLGSRTVPASYISLQLQHGSWRVSELVGSPLP